MIKNCCRLLPRPLSILGRRDWSNNPWVGNWMEGRVEGLRHYSLNDRRLRMGITPVIECSRNIHGTSGLSHQAVATVWADSFPIACFLESSREILFITCNICIFFCQFLDARIPGIDRGIICAVAAPEPTQYFENLESGNASANSGLWIAIDWNRGMFVATRRVSSALRRSVAGNI